MSTRRSEDAAKISGAEPSPANRSRRIGSTSKHREPTKIARIGLQPLGALFRRNKPPKAKRAATPATTGSRDRLHKETQETPEKAASLGLPDAGGHHSGEKPRDYKRAATPATGAEDRLHRETQEPADDSSTRNSSRWAPRSKERATENSATSDTGDKWVPETGSTGRRR